MDRAERLISNRGSRRLLLGWGIGIVLAGIGSYLLSGRIAGQIISQEIRTILGIAGGGSVTDSPDPLRIKVGSEQLAPFGIYEDAPPNLLPDYSAARTAVFIGIFVFAAVLLTLFALYAYFHTDRIYQELEGVYQDCMKLAEQPDSKPALRGTDNCSLRRVCSGIRYIAEQSGHASTALRKEKQQLSDFLADFSHQLKGSLSAVRLNRDMLNELKLPPEEQERLSGEITEQLDRMESLVLEGLKLAKLDASAVQYQFTETALTETCRIAESRVLPLFRQKGISLSLSGDSDIRLPHDRVWLCEAIENLLRNAAEHAGCTETVIALEQLPGAIKLTVTDNGTGIPPERIRHLFDRFSSGSSAPDHTGIGMAIANRVFAAHGAALTVFSAPDTGTQFLAVFCGTGAASE